MPKRFTATQNAIENGLEKTKPAQGAKLIADWEKELEGVEVSGAKGIAGDLARLRKELEKDAPKADAVQKLLAKLGAATAKIADKVDDDKVAEQLRALGEALGDTDASEEEDDEDEDGEEIDEVEEGLADLYVAELQDLYSANAQMRDVVGELAEHVADPELRKMVDTTLTKIGEHNELLKGLVEELDEEADAEHCKGMEGLVEEARKHGIEEEYDEPVVRDAAIIAQLQRMTHYGLAGYGTARAFAQALGLNDAAEKLGGDLAQLYDGDKYLSRIAESRVNRAAA